MALSHETIANRVQITGRNKFSSVLGDRLAFESRGNCFSSLKKVHEKCFSSMKNSFRPTNHRIFFILKNCRILWTKYSVYIYKLDKFSIVNCLIEYFDFQYICMYNLSRKISVLKQILNEVFPLLNNWQSTVPFLYLWIEIHFVLYTKCFTTKLLSNVINKMKEHYQRVDRSYEKIRKTSGNILHRISNFEAFEKFYSADKRMNFTFEKETHRTRDWDALNIIVADDFVSRFLNG